MIPEQELDGMRWAFDSGAEVELLNRHGGPGVQSPAAWPSAGTVHVECGRFHLKARYLREKLD